MFPTTTRNWSSTVQVMLNELVSGRGRMAVFFALTVGAWSTSREGLRMTTRETMCAGRL